MPTQSLNTFLILSIGEAKALSCSLENHLKKGGGKRWSIVAIPCPIFTYKPSLSLHAMNKIKITLKDILSNVLMYLHVIILIELYLIRVENFKATSYGTQIPCKDVGLGEIVICVCRPDQGPCEDGQLFHFQRLSMLEVNRIIFFVKIQFRVVYYKQLVIKGKFNLKFLF